MIYLWTKPWRITLLWFCWQIKLMIYLCTNIRLIQLLWICWQSTIMICCFVAASLGAYSYHDLRTKANSWYICEPRLSALNEHEFACKNTTSLYMYAPSLGACTLSLCCCQSNLVAWICHDVLPEQTHCIFMHLASVHTTIMVWHSQQIMIYVCTKPRCTQLICFRYQWTIISTFCTKPRCIQLSWFGYFAQCLGAKRYHDSETDGNN